MPNQVSPVNFFAGANPGLYAQQQNLNAQQALAQQMMQSGSEMPDPTRTAGRFVVRQSPLESMTHAGKMMASAMMQKNINNRQAQLAQQQTQALMSLLQGGGQQQPTNPMVPGQPGSSVMAGGGETIPQAPPQQPQQRSPLSVTGDPSKDVGLMMAGNLFGPQYGAALAEQYKPGAGQINVRPGGTVYNSMTGKPDFYAPILPAGSAPVNPQNPTAGVQPIPGAQGVAAGMAGATAQAQAAGKAPFEFEHVTTPTGATIPVPRSVLASGGPMPQQQGGPGVPALGQSTYSKEFAQQAAKASNEYVDELRGQARDSVDQNRMLDELQKSIQDFGAGKAAGMRKAIAQWRVQAGIADEETQKIAASAETGDKLVGQLTSNALKKLSARPTQMEFQIFKDQYVPNMAMTPQGAQQVIQFMRQQNNLANVKYQKFNQWRGQQHPDTDLRDFDLHWNPAVAQAPLTSSQSFPNQGQPQGSGQLPSGAGVINWNDLGRGR